MHKEQKSIQQLEQELYARTDSNASSIVQGNTPDINHDYQFQQQTDIQRKDQKPHIAPSPPKPDESDSNNPSEHDGAPDNDRGRSEQGIGKGNLPEEAIPDENTLTADDPGHTERYVSSTPYHR